MTETRKLVAAFRFQNGMIIAFDQFEQQWGEYGGPEAEAVPKIRRDWPNVIIEDRVWPSVADRRRIR